MSSFHLRRKLLPAVVLSTALVAASCGDDEPVTDAEEELAEGSVFDPQSENVEAPPVTPDALTETTEATEETVSDAEEDLAAARSSIPNPRTSRRRP